MSKTQDIDIITPNDIRVPSAELVVLGHIICEKDNNLLLKLRKEHFVTYVSLIDKLIKAGLKAPQILIQHFADAGDISASSFIDEAMRTYREVLTQSGTPDIQDFIDILLDKHVKRQICDISLEIQNLLSEDRESGDILNEIDKGLSKIDSLSTGREQAEGYAQNLIDDWNIHPTLGINTGLRVFDEFGGIVRGTLVNVCGLHKNMKSTSTISLVRSILYRNPKMKACLFQIEMTGKDMTLMMLGQNGINRTDVIKGKVFNNDIETVLLHDPLIKRIKIFSHDTHRIHTWHQIKRILDSEKPDIWVIDYMGQLISNESAVSRREKGHQTLYFSETLNDIKITAQKSNSICFLLHQLNSKDARFRNDPRPQSSDIEWTSDAARLGGYTYLCYYPCKYFKYDDERMKRVFFQMLVSNRYAEDAVAVLEVDPASGIFKDPSQEIRDLAQRHWAEMEYKVNGRYGKLEAKIL